MIAWGSLEHCDMTCAAFAHCREDRNRGCTRPDNHSLLVLIVQVLGPELRVHDLTGEVLDAWDVRFKALRWSERVR